MRPRPAHPHRRPRAAALVLLLAALTAGAVLAPAARGRSSAAGGAHPVGERSAAGGAAAVLAEADSLRRAVRLARILNVPARLVPTEEAYARHLDRAAVLVGSSAARGDTSALMWRLVVHLLGARHPAGAAWLSGAATRHRPIPAGRPECAFWVGLAEWRRDRVRSAASWLGRPVPAPVRDYAEWMRIRALGKSDDAQAGTIALQLARTRSDHRFRVELLLRGARHLVGAGDPRGALDLLARLAEGPPPDAEQTARARLWAARAHRDLGEPSAFHRALAEALAGGPVNGEDPNLALGLAREGLRSDAPEEELRDRCAGVLAAGAPLDEVLALWRRRQDELGESARLAVLDKLLGRLRSARREGAISDLVQALSAGPDARLARRAWLEEARVLRKRGQTRAMERAYRTAAAWESGEAVLASGEAAVGAALWEWGRELEDAGRFAEAAAAYGRRAVWERAAQATPEAAMRAGICAWRAGDRAAALAHLDEACASAPPRLVGAPCFWRGVLAGERPDPSHLRKAAAEERPGYAARRAQLALRPRGAGGAPESPGAVWDEAAAGARNPHDWDWPDAPPAFPPAEAERLLAAIEGRPALADAATLLAALGHPRWSREMAEKLAGAGGWTGAQSAAVRRALGDFAGAYTDGSGGGHEEYPVAYAHAVAAASRRFGVSAAFLQAVMRQESGLDPAIRSSAGAVGLMQLMPATARRVASSLGMSHYSLERPEDNVTLGAAYLAQLLKESGGDVAVCLASYNAGRGNAVRWLGRVEGVPAELRWDAYLEAIGFHETRTFVRRVLRHYWGIRAAFPPPAGLGD